MFKYMRGCCVHIKEGIMWIEGISKSMVWKIYQSYAQFGIQQSQCDHTLFIRHSISGKVTILLVYVDDIIMTGGDLEGMESLKKCLIKQFEIKELGKLKYFLGIEVAHS